MVYKCAALLYFKDAVCIGKDCIKDGVDIDDGLPCTARDGGTRIGLRCRTLLFPASGGRAAGAQGVASAVPLLGHASPVTLPAYTTYLIAWGFHLWSKYYARTEYYVRRLKHPESLLRLHLWCFTTTRGSFMCQLGMDNDGHDPIIASWREGDTHLIQWKSTLRKIPNPPWSHCQGYEINATHHHHRVVDGVSWCSLALPASWETTWASGAIFGQGWKPITLLNFDHGCHIVVGGVVCGAVQFLPGV